MSKKYNIEELLTKKLEGLEIEPSGNAWLKTSRVVRRKQFFRFSARKFNVYYVAGIVAAGAALVYFSLAEDAEIQSEVVKVSSNKETVVEIPTEDISKDIQVTEQPTSTIEAKVSSESKLSEIKGHVIIDEPIQETSQAEEEIDTENWVEYKTMVTFFTVSVTEGCAPLSVELVDLSENAVEREWEIQGKRKQVKGKSVVFEYEGKYTVTLKTIGEDGSIGYHSEEITVHPKPVADFEIEDGQVYNYSTDAIEYEWKLDNREVIHDFQPELSGIEGHRKILLTAKNVHGCIDTLSSILPLPPSPTLSFPTAFSPNPNGPSSGHYNPNELSNDIFHPRFTEEPIEYQLTIYNRAGELIFQTNDIHIGWDGYYREAPVMRGVYIWKCTGKWQDGSLLNLQGDITALWTN